MASSRSLTVVSAALLAYAVTATAQTQETPPAHQAVGSVVQRLHLLAVAMPSKSAFENPPDDLTLTHAFGAGVDLQLEGPRSSAVRWRAELALLSLHGDLDVALYAGIYGHVQYRPVFTVFQAGLGARIRLLERPRFDLHLSPMLYWQSFYSHSDYEADGLLGGATYGAELGLDLPPPPGRSWYWSAVLRGLAGPRINRRSEALI